MRLLLLLDKQSRDSDAGNERLLPAKLCVSHRHPVRLFAMPTKGCKTQSVGLPMPHHGHLVQSSPLISKLWQVLIKQFLHCFGLQRIAAAFHGVAFTLGGHPPLKRHKDDGVNGIHAGHAAIAGNDHSREAG